MELADLRSFVVLAEELHFGRAAERLHVTQPPLTRRIRRLEAELGVLLLRRTTRRVELTDAGRELLVESRRALAALDAAVESVRRTHRGETGRLLVGSVSSAVDGFLPALVREFRLRNPGIEVSI